MIKTKLKNFMYKNIMTITWGFKEIKLSEDIKGKFVEQLFIDYGYDIPMEMKGYQKHYIPEEGDVIIDVGSYIGEYAIYAGKLVGDSGKVVCIEPDEGNIKLLKKNIKLNNLNNIEIIKKGLWSENRLLKFKSYSAGSIFSEEGILKVEAIKLDTLVEELKLKKINFIKMDIEGAELEALKGCREVMINFKPEFAIASYHRVNGEKSFKELEKMFKEKGYDYVTEYPEHLTTYARRKK